MTGQLAGNFQQSSVQKWEVETGSKVFPQLIPTRLTTGTTTITTMYSLYYTI